MNSGDKLLAIIIVAMVALGVIPLTAFAIADGCNPHAPKQTVVAPNK